MRHLAPEEAALWDRVARTVTPIAGRRAISPQGRAVPSPRLRPVAAAVVDPAADYIPALHPQRTAPLSERTGLDAGWERKLARGTAGPDFTLDLHGCTLDAAYARLDHGLALALAQDARLVLLITGRTRPGGDNAGRGERRGAIRAKFMDWLTAGPHASRIAAVRPAHPRHGGAGRGLHRAEANALSV